MIMTISKPCAGNLHAACPETRETCGCESCHKGPCAHCEADNLLAIYDGVCAPCRRLQPRPAYQPMCEECGNSGGFRNPRARRPEVLCIECHVKTGIPLTLRRIDTAAIASCHGKEDGHDWGHIRGTRFACTRCYVRKFDAPLRAAMRKEELRG